jgi:hypothetical protein
MALIVKIPKLFGVLAIQGRDFTACFAGKFFFPP